MFGGLIEVRPLPLAGFLVGVYVVAWFIQAALVDYRIAKRGGGGVRAPRIASNIFTGMSFIFVEECCQERKKKGADY